MNENDALPIVRAIIAEVRQTGYDFGFRAGYDKAIADLKGKKDGV